MLKKYRNDGCNNVNDSSCISNKISSFTFLPKQKYVYISLVLVNLRGLYDSFESTYFSGRKPEISVILLAHKNRGCARGYFHVFCLQFETAFSFSIIHSFLRLLLMPTKPSQCNYTKAH